MIGILAVSPNNNVFVLDSWPVMEWLKGRESAATRFDFWIVEARAGRMVLLISTINVGEVFYNTWSEWDEARAEVVYRDLKKMPVYTIHPTEEDALVAARLKGRHKIAYGDAFATVLAFEFEATVLSRDPHFRDLRDAGVVLVEWLGR